MFRNILKSYNVYTALANQENLQDAVIIKDGFNFIALLFGAIWLIYNEIWLAAILVALVDCVLVYCVQSTMTLWISWLCVSLYVGLKANEWLGKKLQKNNYEWLGIVVAPSVEQARLRLLDNKEKYIK